MARSVLKQTSNQVVLREGTKKVCKKSHAGGRVVIGLIWPSEFQKLSWTCTLAQLYCGRIRQDPVRARSRRTPVDLHAVALFVGVDSLCCMLSRTGRQWQM